MILISDNCNCGSTSNSCNCGSTCVGGLTCHCNDNTTFICPGGNCSTPNNGNCGCGCCPPEQPLPETHRVLRLLAPSRGTHTYWTDKDPVILEGVIGLTKDRLFPGSLEYFIGDGEHKYSELPKYGGAEASILSKAYTLVLRDANGKIDKASLPTDLSDLVDVPDATPTVKGIVKASTTTQPDNAVKSDSNGSLEGWKNAIVDAITDNNGANGLTTDNNGNLAVDFSQMPTAKFEALLKSLKMLVPLSANKTIYVDTNHSNAGDTIIDGRGEEVLPFKTIQAAVDYVTSTYSIGAYKVYIRIKAGTYDEGVSLPTYTRTSGSIEIISDSGNQNDVIIHPLISPDTGTRQSGFVAGGGFWILRHLTVERIENPTTSTTAAPGCYQAEGANTTLSIYGCAAIQKMPEGLDFTDKNNYVVRIFEATLGATIRLMHDATPGVIHAEKTTDGPVVHVFSITRDGTLALAKNSAARTIECEGSCSTFINMNQKGKLTSLSSGPLIEFVNNNVTGKRYSLSSGATGLDGLSLTYFPGDTEGTVDANTFCWYN